MALTKEDIKAIREVVKIELDPLVREILVVKKNTDGLREQIQELTITLDKFVKMMTDYKEEFILLKKEVDVIKSFIKEKFGVEISIQGK